MCIVYKLERYLLDIYFIEEGGKGGGREGG